MKNLFFGLLLVSSITQGVAAEWTGPRFIDEVKVREATSTAYLFTATVDGWGAPSCPNADTVIISNSLALKESILSVALSAKMAKVSVKFNGTCLNDSIFSADYIVIQ